MALVQKFKPPPAATFQVFSEKVFEMVTSTSSKRIDVVFDTHKQISICYKYVVLYVTKWSRGVNCSVLHQTRSKSWTFCCCNGKTMNLEANSLTGNCMSQAKTSARSLHLVLVNWCQSCSATTKKQTRASFSMHNTLVASVPSIVTTLTFSLFFSPIPNLLVSLASRKEKVQSPG